MGKGTGFTKRTILSSVTQFRPKQDWMIHAFHVIESFIHLVIFVEWIAATIRFVMVKGTTSWIMIVLVCARLRLESERKQQTSSSERPDSPEDNPPRRPFFLNDGTSFQSFIIVVLLPSSSSSCRMKKVPMRGKNFHMKFRILPDSTSLERQ